MKLRRLFPGVFAAGALLAYSVMPAAGLSDAPYISPGSYDVIHVLAPPPAPGSEAERRDLEAVLEYQRTSSPERMRLAESDATTDISAFAGVLGVDPAKLPGVAGFFHSIELVTMVVVGGMASVFGSIVGAAILTMLPQLLSTFEGWETVVFGAILMATMIFLPKGIVPTLAARVRRERAP